MKFSICTAASQQLSTVHKCVQAGSGTRRLARTINGFKGPGVMGLFRYGLCVDTAGCLDKTNSEGITETGSEWEFCDENISYFPMCGHLQSHKGIIQALHLLVSFHQCPSGCLSRYSVTTKHQFKTRTPPKGFPMVMLISVHTWSERDLAGGVGSVLSGYNSKADFLVCFLLGRFLTLIPAFNVSYVQPIKLFYHFPSLNKDGG